MQRWPPHLARSLAATCTTAATTTQTINASQRRYLASSWSSPQRLQPFSNLETISAGQRVVDTLILRKMSAGNSNDATPTAAGAPPVVRVDDLPRCLQPQGTSQNLNSANVSLEDITMHLRQLIDNTPSADIIAFFGDLREEDRAKSPHNTLQRSAVEDTFRRIIVSLTLLALVSDAAAAKFSSSSGSAINFASKASAYQQQRQQHNSGEVSKFFIRKLLEVVVALGEILTRTIEARLKENISTSAVDKLFEVDSHNDRLVAGHLHRGLSVLEHAQRTWKGDCVAREAWRTVSTVVLHLHQHKLLKGSALDEHVLHDAALFLPVMEPAHAAALVVLMGDVAAGAPTAVTKHNAGLMSNDDDVFAASLDELFDAPPSIPNNNNNNNNNTTVAIKKKPSRSYNDTRDRWVLLRFFAKDDNASMRGLPSAVAFLRGSVGLMMKRPALLSEAPPNPIFMGDVETWLGILTGNGIVPKKVKGKSAPMLETPLPRHSLLRFQPPQRRFKHGDDAAWNALLRGAVDAHFLWVVDFVGVLHQAGARKADLAAVMRVAISDTVDDEADKKSYWLAFGSEAVQRQLLRIAIEIRRQVINIASNTLLDTLQRDSYVAEVKALHSGIVSLALTGGSELCDMQPFLQEKDVSSKHFVRYSYKRFSPRAEFQQPHSFSQEPLLLQAPPFGIEPSLRQQSLVIALARTSMVDLNALCALSRLMVGHLHSTRRVEPLELGLVANACRSVGEQLMVGAATEKSLRIGGLGIVAHGLEFVACRLGLLRTLPPKYESAAMADTAQLILMSIQYKLLGGVVSWDILLGVIKYVREVHRWRLPNSASGNAPIAAVKQISFCIAVHLALVEATQSPKSNIMSTATQDLAEVLPWLETHVDTCTDVVTGIYSPANEAAAFLMSGLDHLPLFCHPSPLYVRAVTRVSGLGLDTS